MRHLMTFLEAAAFVLSTAVTQGAIITVTIESGGTGGPDCTLRDAITAANTDTPTGGCPAGNGADTIELPTDATILLTEVDNSTQGRNGLPCITSGITISGNGAIIERSQDAGTPNFRIFQVLGAGHLTLIGVTISGGDDGLNLGGGIRNLGTLTLTNSNISGNSAAAGGGISNFGTMTLTDSTVSENEGSASTGGGIINFGSGTVALTSSTVSGNSAATNGGGIRNIDGGTVTLTGSIVSGNSAAVGAGGISNSGTLTLTDSTVDGNSTVSGGGMANANSGTVTLINSTVSNNTAEGHGSGIQNGGILALLNSTISGNAAAFNGGGLWNSSFGTVTLTNSTVSDNTAEGADSGGGIWNVGTVTLSDATICGNAPDQIAGDYTDGGGNLIAEECPPCVSIDLNGDGRVTICHIPPGNPDNAHTITVSINALPAHLAHGDHCGACEEDDGLLMGSSSSDVTAEPCPTDLDDSGDIGAEDLAQVLGSWGPCAGCPADFDSDGVVGAFDLALLLGAWGPCP